MSNSDNDYDPQLSLGDDESALALCKAWEKTLRDLATNPKVSASSFKSFFKPTQALSLDGDTVVLGARSLMAREWLEKRHYNDLKTHLAAYLKRASITLRIVLATETTRPPLGGPEAADEATAPAPVKEKPKPPTRGSGTVVHMPPYAQNQCLPMPLAIPLNDKFTFETFVEGRSNRLALTGAYAVANDPGNAFNPLFLYGGPGLGKTHLMHAIGNAVRGANPGARIAYLSGESFTNGYLAALREKKADLFRAQCRNVDLWLVDDVQMIAGKQHTKEEFFHTFNTLHQLKKQIVISADCSPRELQLMDERLKSRFECGLMTDIAPPELELRVAILQRKAMVEGLQIPEDVLYYVASLIVSNIRSLEGALIKLMLTASFGDMPLSKQLATDVLGAYFGESRSSSATPPRQIGIAEDTDLQVLPDRPAAGGTWLPMHAQSQCFDFERVVAVVASHYGLEPCAIAGEGSAQTARRHNVARARQVAIFLARENTNLAVIELARKFGDVGHSAISHAYRKMSAQAELDPQTASLLQHLSSLL